MFIHNLTKEQQSALLYLANELIHSDGELENAEMAIIETLKKQCELDVILTPIKIEELSTIFASNRAKYSVLLELIAIAYVDEQYHQEEQNLILKYAELLNVSNDMLINLERWVKKQLTLSQEIELLLNQ